MLESPNGGILVQSAQECESLSVPAGCDLYLDFETTSGDNRLDSTNPWFNCKPAGFAVTWDSEPRAWYIPWAEWSATWLRGATQRAKRWINHNVKYDAHVYARNVSDLPPQLELVDTLTGAKIIDSDRGFKGGYGLTALASGWLREDITPYEESLKPYLHKNKDYGAIPVDVIAPYACQDVLTTRRLYKYISQKMHSDCVSVWDTERKLTRILLDAERYGMLVRPSELRQRELEILIELMRLEEELEALVGRSFAPHVSTDCYEVLCVQYGLPVLEYTEDGNPSFDKDAMQQYLVHPLAPRDVVQKIARYRKISTHRNLFLKPYQELNIEGVLHPSYNQCVRTGRLSCSSPNSQQLDKLAKALVHPRPGNAFLSFDLSQIEFRFMMHYIDDAPAIAAYKADPDTDFHQWVAEMAGTKRRPAKTINFMIGFGGGKKKCVKLLSGDSDVVGDVMAQVAHIENTEERQRAFDEICKQRGEKLYDRYHDSLPGIKRTSRKAGAVAYARGYVRNIAGRHRHLPPDHCHRAFNSLNQSSAADLQKNRTVALAAWLPPEVRLVATVHDETLLEGPREVIEDSSFIRGVVSLMETDPWGIRVPIRGAVGTSRESWATAVAAQKPLK